MSQGLALDIIHGGDPQGIKSFEESSSRGKALHSKGGDVFHPEPHMEPQRGTLTRWKHSRTSLFSRGRSLTQGDLGFRAWGGGGKDPKGFGLDKHRGPVSLGETTLGDDVPMSSEGVSESFTTVTNQDTLHTGRKRVTVGKPMLTVDMRSQPFPDDVSHVCLQRGM